MNFADSEPSTKIKIREKVVSVVNVPRADAARGQGSQLPIVRTYPRRHNRGQPPVRYEPGFN